MKTTTKLKLMKAAVEAEKVMKKAERAAVSVTLAGGAALALAVPAAAEGEDVATNAILTGLDFSPVVDTVVGAIPAVMPVLVTLVGIQKAIYFVIGMIKGA